MTKKTITLELPEEVFNKIDSIAQKQGGTRSGVIKQVLFEKLYSKEVVSNE